MTREQFIKQYYPAAAQVTQGSGIFPEVMMAQAILESSGRVDGQWFVGQSLLARAGNNYFGIKASPGWKGEVISLRTGEYLNGQRVTVTGQFRKYPTVMDSFRDYVRFLKENPRYEKAGVFAATTPAAQTAALQRAGYATDPNYSKILNSVMDGFKKWIPSVPVVAFGLLLPAVIFFLIMRNQKLI